MSTFRRSPRERGASAVEFALVLPLFVLLIFGGLEFLFAFGDMNSLRSGVREGVRGAAVADYGASTSCTVVSGTAIPPESTALLCRTKDRIGLNASLVRVSMKLPVPYELGQPILICAQTPFGNRTKILGSAITGLTLKAKLSMRTESIDTDLASFAEDPLPGTSWGWCT